MNLKLENTEFSESGIFGIIEDENTMFALETLQHAYQSPAGWVPKLPPGQYECIRGIHQLHNMIDQFETFEITGVPGHTGILFHCGNFNRDSEGCVLLGYRKEGVAIVHSKEAFQEFMDYLKDIYEFDLTVI